jgi:Kef-type K+ transport system membrane component KefB
VGVFAKNLLVEIVGSAVVGLMVGWVLTQYIRLVGREMPVMVIIVCLLLSMLAHLESLHLSTLLMGLTAGFYVENFSEGDVGTRLIHGVERLSLPIYCLFFAIAGLALPLDEFAALWHLVPILAALRVGLIWLGTRAAGRLAAGEEVVGRWLWAGMVSQAGISLAMASLVQKSFPEWGAAAATLLIAMIAANEIIGPILLNTAMKRSGEAEAAAA